MLSMRLHFASESTPSFSGPLLFIGGFESGLVHLFGPSSVGKTTLLRVAASVWGSGADGGYVRAWRATANGLEASLACACDTLLPLDELGQADGREIGQVVYMIAGAVGKTRMRRDATLKPSHMWRVLALSSGETPIAALLGEGQKVKGAHAGQQVRAIDVPSRREMGVFDRPYVDFDPKAFVDQLKRAASNYYGVAGPEFVRGLIERRVAGKDLRKLVDDFILSALNGIVDNQGQAARVAERFGLIAAAGKLAAEFGLAPWPQGSGG
jgi:putative DNA primase/helicase